MEEIDDWCFLLEREREKMGVKERKLERKRKNGREIVVWCVFLNSKPTRMMNLLTQIFIRIDGGLVVTLERKGTKGRSSRRRLLMLMKSKVLMLWTATLNHKVLCIGRTTRCNDILLRTVTDVFSDTTAVDEQQCWLIVKRSSSDTRLRVRMS